MRFIFKTTYEQDIRLVKHGGQAFWYGLLGLALAAAPLLPEYYLSQLTFVCIYALVGVGLMLLTGYTGQISLGHAAFLAVGAYTEAVLTGLGAFVLSLVVSYTRLGHYIDSLGESFLGSMHSPAATPDPQAETAESSSLERGV